MPTGDPICSNCGGYIGTSCRCSEILSRMLGSRTFDITPLNIGSGEITIEPLNMVSLAEYNNALIRIGELQEKIRQLEQRIKELENG
jgi:hypothetical protein